MAHKISNYPLTGSQSMRVVPMKKAKLATKKTKPVKGKNGK